ncbi:thioredoxin family protein [bacterium]|nr:thioredoxin family protein [bacterium]
MSKKSILTILAILILPLVAFWILTFTKDEAVIAEANGRPQVFKFSSTMCAECKEVEKTFQELLPKYEDKFVYTEVIVDSRNDMKNALIKKHNVTLVPTVVMVNSDGTVHKRVENSIPKEEMEEYIKGLH